MDYDAVFRVIDAFIPFDVLTGVFVIFALENAMAAVIGPASLLVWLGIGLAGLVVFGSLRYLSFDDEEMEDLSEDIDDI